MFEIRKAGLKDVDIVYKLLMELHADQAEVLRKYSPQHSYDFKKSKQAEKIFQNFLKRSIRSRNALVLLAEVNGEIAGYSLIRIKQNFPLFKLERLGEILDLYVREKYRGIGISTRFKDEGLKWLRKKKIAKVMIVVLPDNKKAKRIYKKWGFTYFVQEMRMNL